jgi:hypothetical protein
MSQFRILPGISSCTAEVLDSYARAGGVVGVAEQWSVRGPEEQAHGYGSVWRDTHGCGNRGVLCLTALDPASRQAKLLAEGHRKAWLTVIAAFDGAEKIALEQRGVIFSRKGESHFPECDLDADWGVSLTVCGIARARVVARLAPRSDRARELLREGRRRELVNATSCDPALAYRIVVAGETIRRGYAPDVLAQAALTPASAWESLPMSNKAIPAWAARHAAPLTVTSVERLRAARDIQEASHAQK